MSKNSNRIGVTIRINRNELTAIVSAMSIIGVQDLKTYVKFATLKLAEIIQQQKQEQLKAEKKQSEPSEEAQEKSDRSEEKSNG